MRGCFSLVTVFLILCIIPNFLMATPGDTVKTFRTPYMCPQGLTFDGKYIWCADRRSDMIYKIDPNFTIKAYFEG